MTTRGRGWGRLNRRRLLWTWQDGRNHELLAVVVASQGSLRVRQSVFSDRRRKELRYWRT